MTPDSLAGFLIERYGADLEVVLSCSNRYEINKKLNWGEDHRGTTWRQGVSEQWRCPQCGADADGLYFLVLEDVLKDGSSVYLPTDV